MDKKKFGIILATIGGIGLFICFIMFTLGGFMSVRYMRTSPFVIIGFIGFAVSMIVLAVGAGLRGSGDIKEIASSINTDRMVESAKSIKDAISSINKTTCAYCGTVYSSKENKCPNCGSSNKKQ